MLSIDSAEVIHGMFKMEGITDSTSMASLYMDDEKKSAQNAFRRQSL